MCGSFLLLFLPFGICKLCRFLDPIDVRLVAEQVLVVEFDFEAFVLRRLACCGIGSEESICTERPSFGDRFRTQQDHTSLRKAHHTTLGTYPCVPGQWRMLHTRLQKNISQLVVSCASSKQTLRQWRTHRARCSDERPGSGDISWMIQEVGSPRLRPRP